MTTIISDPSVQSGAWFIEGTSIQALAVAARLHKRLSDEQVRIEFPELPPTALADVRHWMTGKEVDCNRRLIRNAAFCLLCDTEIESAHRHDIVRCNCGNIVVDGGTGRTGYYRRSGALDQQGVSWVDLSVFEGDQTFQTG